MSNNQQDKDVNKSIINKTKMSTHQQDKDVNKICTTTACHCGSKECTRLLPFAYAGLYYVDIHEHNLILEGNSLFTEANHVFLHKQILPCCVYNACLQCHSGHIDEARCLLQFTHLVVQWSMYIRKISPDIFMCIKYLPTISVV